MWHPCYTSIVLFLFVPLPFCIYSSTQVYSCATFVLCHSPLFVCAIFWFLYLYRAFGWMNDISRNIPMFPSVLCCSWSVQAPRGNIDLYPTISPTWAIGTKSGFQGRFLGQQYQFRSGTKARHKRGLGGGAKSRGRNYPRPPISCFFWSGTARHGVCFIPNVHLRSELES